MAFNKRKVLISALGVAEPYCYLQKPDYGHGDFKNERGTYKVSLTISNDDPRCQQMIDEIVEAHEADYAARLEEYEANPPKVVKGKKPLKPYVGDMPFIDNEDGTTTFNFKCYGNFTDKKTGENRPIELKVVDSRGKRINEVPAISGGSELKIRYSLFPYGWSAVAGASVKLQLEGVMLVKLVEFGGGDDDWGDEVVDDEDGYIASNQKPREQSRQAPSDNDDEQEDDDGDF
ncbi:Gp2.5-like ssDNA binding protein and ssDNA annealing protein [Dickeya phage Ninurta]|uniref:Single-stranded DNA-binding protein n=1 Tax=Dickeya phage Ninurta TaxID=2163631 RepID=A0A2S1GTC8_9CAUD|nr:Gp2.5-like ssDNA binding protein and ssDNA annealing protein [Dickeya phage Ninurta]AWD92634.1 single-stranded DNA-binding protein [Dickeya phage Ninurta]